MTSSEPVSSDPFLEGLVATLNSDARVVGLVLTGSSADLARRDQWSDHDFLVITKPGVQERYRTDLSWLPDHEEIGWWFRETAHGLKVLYRSGLLLEFAVFDRASFATCALHQYRVVIDRQAPGETDEPSITTLAAEVRARSSPASRPDPVDAFRHFLSLVYVGTGRARRGERLSANVFLRDYATAALLRLVRDLVDTPPDRLDALDPWRRAEATWPELAARIDRAISLPTERVGQALLNVAATELAPRWDHYPRADLELVERLLADDAGETG